MALSGCVSLESPDLSSLTPERSGWKALQSGETETAYKLFTKEAEEKPDSPQGHYGLGRVALAQGDRALAADHLRRAVSCEGASADTWAYLGTAQLQLEQNADALVSLQQALTLDPQNGQALVAMAEYSAHVDVDYDKALQLLEHAKATGYAAIPRELEHALRHKLN